MDIVIPHHGYNNGNYNPMDNAHKHGAHYTQQNTGMRERSPATQQELLDLTTPEAKPSAFSFM